MNCGSNVTLLVCRLIFGTAPAPWTDNDEVAIGVLAVIVIVPELTATAVGLKTTEMVQDALAATLGRQVLEAAGIVNSGLEDCTEVIVKPAFPQLLTLNV